jgi:hypothetical protein
MNENASVIKKELELKPSSKPTDVLNADTNAE